MILHIRLSGYISAGPRKGERQGRKGRQPGLWLPLRPASVVPCTTAGYSPRQPGDVRLACLAALAFSSPRGDESLYQESSKEQAGAPLQRHCGCSILTDFAPVISAARRNQPASTLQ